MKTIQLAIAASLGLALAPRALAADTGPGGTATQTQTQDRERVRSQVHHQLTHEGGATEQEAAEVDGEVKDHAAHAGYGPAISKAIHDAHAAGCTGPCQVALIHDINHAMDQGATAGAAATKATDRVAHASGKPADPQARSAEHRMDADHRHDADRGADMAHDRAQDHGQGHAGGRAMGSGHH